MAVLNRLYIVVGILAILTLLAGFIVPRFIDWGGYRAQLEAMAEANLGTDIIIAGDINFVLLPQPQIRLGKTIVGPALAPLVQIETVIADFSLLDFLRDRFTITNLVLRSPQINLVIEETGEFRVPLALDKNFNNGRISVATAKIINGSLKLQDQRSDQRFELGNFDGDLTISDMAGPFRLQGNGRFGQQPISLRVSLSAINQQQQAQTSFFLTSGDGDYTIDGEGLLKLGIKPEFAGQSSIRISPPDAGEDGSVRGDMIFSSKVELSGEKLLFPAFEIQPDENRVGSRLSGAAVMEFGELANFDVVISGSVVALAPVGIRQSNDDNLIELLALFSQISSLPMVNMPGRIGADIAELSVGNVALRDVRLDVLSDGKNWQLERLLAKLPGNSDFSLSGNFFEEQGEIVFAGKTSVQTKSMGALAQLWISDQSSSEIFTSSGQMLADVSLKGAVLQFRDGQLELEDSSVGFSTRFEFLDQPKAQLSLTIGELDAGQSQNILSLIPERANSGAFLRSFPVGSLSINVEQAVLFDMDIKAGDLQLGWGSGGIEISRFAAQNFGGAQLNLSGNIAGSFVEPVVTGQGRILLNETAANNFLPVAVGYLGGETIIADWVEKLLPIDTYINFRQPDENGIQGIVLQGLAGATDFDLNIFAEQGVLKLLDAPVEILASMNSTEGDLLSKQLGAGDVLLFMPGETINIEAQMQGMFKEQLQANVRVISGDDILVYAGNLSFSDIKNVEAEGQLDFAISNLSPLGELLGAGGIYLPGANGSAKLIFGPDGRVGLSDLTVLGELGEINPLQGEISITIARTGREATKTVSGQVSAAQVDVEQLLAIIAGPASLIRGQDIWPIGPIDLGLGSLNSRGKVSVLTPILLLADKALMLDTGFDLVWNDNSIAIENLIGKSLQATGDAGNISASLKICCAGDASKQLLGRLAIEMVPISDIGMGDIGQNIAGLLESGVQFEANGGSVAQLVASLSGEGSFSIAAAKVLRLDPAVFEFLANLESLPEPGSNGIGVVVEKVLSQGDFLAKDVGGTFLISGGVLRARNIVLSSQRARLLGDIKLDLADISLGGGWTFQRVGNSANRNEIDQDSVNIAFELGGTLLAPTREIDLEQLFGAIQVRALEAELKRLEQLRQEQILRSREAALERAQRMELFEQRQQREAQARADAAEAEAILHAQQQIEFDLESQDPLLFTFDLEKYLDEITLP